MIGALIFHNSSMILSLNEDSLRWLTNTDWPLEGTIYLKYRETKEAGYDIVYSGSHHRTWCGHGVHFTQYVNHKSLPHDHYEYFKVGYFYKCDCAY